MKCYRHQLNDSIGICKSCGKALCPECAIDLEFALTCPGPCEQTALAHHKLNSNAIAAYSEQQKNRYFGPLFFCTLGLVYLGYGLSEGIAFSFSVVVGLCFFTFGLALFGLQIRYNRRIRT